jgi:glycosyltransferase involved in cell wall biosynthesis
MSTVSLCLIVKDVGPFIEGCLASVVSWVDEVIIVDTGSHDNTVDVIRAAVPGDKLKLLFFTPETSPKGFLLDADSSWEARVPGPFSGTHMLVDFASARNMGWQAATGDWLMWIDSDDVLEGGEKLRSVLEDMEEKKIDSTMLNYDYDFDGDGHVIMRLMRERIVKRSLGTYWSGVVHEVIMPSIGLVNRYDELNVVHKRSRLGIEPTVKNRNIKILLKWVEERKHMKDHELDARMLFYLGREMMWIWPERAIAEFRRFLKFSGSAEERSIAHVYSGMLHEKSGRWEEAIKDYAAASIEFMPSPDGFFGAARAAYYKSIQPTATVKLWTEIVEWTVAGVAVRDNKAGVKGLQTEEPGERYYRPYVFLSAALVNLRRWSEAVAACDDGLKWNDKDPHLLGNKEVALARLNEQKEPQMSNAAVDIRFRRDEPVNTPAMDLPHEILMTFALQLWKRRLVEDEASAMAMLDTLPMGIQKDPKIVEAREFVLNKGKVERGELPRVEEKSSSDVVAVERRPFIEVGKKLLKIIIWTGPAWEEWNSESVEQGIGGSETAAACMGREMARRGHSVVVLGQCSEEKAGVFDGVTYIDHSKALSGTVDAFKSDVFITSRQPGVLSHGFPALVKALWVHDIHVGENTPMLAEQLMGLDVVFALTNWHKDLLLQTYPYLSPKTVEVIRNGIDVSRFAGEPKKIGNRCIYASSPDRGLERLLKFWPKIRAKVSDAELHVYYGFNTWKRMAEYRNDVRAQFEIQRFEKLLKINEPNGVHYHGRVGQKELAKAYMEAKVWAYPTWFAETFCISAIEAQAAGCVPVTSAHAALNETVQNGFLLAMPDTTPEYEAAFVERVSSLLLDEGKRREVAARARAQALAKWGWDKLAGEWEVLFARLLDEKGSRRGLAVPAYGGD